MMPSKYFSTSIPVFVCLFAFMVLLTSCRRSETDSSAKPATIRLACTTSFRDSGIAEILIKEFQTRHKIHVELVCVGSGAAIQLGRTGDVDVLIVHSPEDEIRFMNEGFGQRRETFMYNSFVLLGPDSGSDPAKQEITNQDNSDDVPVEKVFQQIANSGRLFVSRGDRSGTHRREQELWRNAGAKPADKQYLETGQGMGATLIVADQKQAFTLCDYGTYLKFRRKIQLTAKVQNQESLLNFYSVLTVDPETTGRQPNSNADTLVEFLLSETTQKLIESYTIQDKSLFFSIGNQKESIKP